jgi:hypothetical protein
MTRSHSLHYSCFSLSLSPALGFLYTDSVAIFFIGLELGTATHPGQWISFFWNYFTVSLLAFRLSYYQRFLCMLCDYRRMYSSRFVITFLARCGLLEVRALHGSFPHFACCSFETSIGILVQFYTAHP